MKEILKQYAAYHSWANQRIIKAVLNLPEELLLKELPSSFSSVHKTLMHMWDAELIWWQRLNRSNEMVTPMSFKGSTMEIARALQQLDETWEQWVMQASEPMLLQAFEYKNSKGEQFVQPVYQMLLHLLNHGTYHRGQLANMLRQSGTTNIPATDFIVWSRSGS